MIKLAGKRGNRLTARRRGLRMRPWAATRASPASRRGLGRPFASRVFEVVRRIGRGKTLTYKQVAALVGSPQAARTVGNILVRNYDPLLPCHRVIRSDGAPGGYNRGGPEGKLALLQAEKTKI